MSAMERTDYRIEKFENSDWAKAYRGDTRVSMCMNEEAVLHSIWVEEGMKHDDFYVADKDGCVFIVDRGAL